MSAWGEGIDLSGLDATLRSFSAAVSQTVSTLRTAERLMDAPHRARTSGGSSADAVSAASADDASRGDCCMVNRASIRSSHCRLPRTITGRWQTWHLRMVARLGRPVHNGAEASHRLWNAKIGNILRQMQNCPSCAGAGNCDACRALGLAKAMGWEGATEVD